MRLKLYIQGEEIDTFQDQSLQLVREIYTKDNVASIDIAYSQQVTIPATERNQRLFDYVHLLDNWEKPSPHLPYEGIASLEDGNDIKVVVEIRGFTYERSVIKTYQITFYVYATELFSHFGNENIADVDFSALDFVLNQENVIASWEVGGTDYFCPIMAHSQNMLYLTDSPASPVPGDIAHEDSGILITECKPSYLLTKVMEIIFQTYGVTVTWDSKIAAHLAEAFILPSKSAGALISEQQFDDFYFFGQRRTNFVFTGMHQVLEMEEEISDEGDNWYDQKYHCPYSGQYNVKVHFNQTILSTIQVGHRVNGGSWNDVSYFKKLGTANMGIVCNAGDYIEFGVLGVPGVSLEGSTIEVKSFEGEAGYGTTVTASLQMPEMKVAEFIKGFLAAFKLTMLQTGKNTYKIYDTKSIYAEGTIRDWSSYVDMKVMTYQKRDAFRRLVLTHSKGEDAYNVLFENYSGRRFGAVNYDTGLIFGTLEVTMESPFTIFPPVWLGRQDSDGNADDTPTDLLIHQQVNQSGEPINSKFLLFYRNGSDGTDHPYWLQDGVDSNGATFSQVDTFGYYSANKSLECDTDVPALTYGMENPAIGIPSEMVLAYEFWRDMLEIFINNSAFQLPSIPFRLPASEMSAFTIQDTILINGIYHIPVKAVYDYHLDILKLDLIIYHPTYQVTLPVMAGASGEFKNPLDVNVEVMHTLNGRRFGDRIYRPPTRELWRPKKI